MSFHSVIVVTAVIGSSAMTHTVTTEATSGMPRPYSRRAMNARSTDMRTTWTRATAPGDSQTNDTSQRRAVWAIGCELKNSNVVAWFHWSIESLLISPGNHPSHHTSMGSAVAAPAQVAIRICRVESGAIDGMVRRLSDRAPNSGLGSRGGYNTGHRECVEVTVRGVLPVVFLDHW